jgi:creatinine amidohydrolase
MLAEHMTWKEYQEKIRKSVVILPMGSLEQHGPHLPLCVDVVIPSNFARMVAGKVNAMVLPPLTYGYKSQPTSGGGPLFPGTTSLDGNTLIHMVLDILRDTYRHGGRKFLLINGHYENVAFATEAVDLFLREVKDKDVKVLILNWWDQVPDDLIPELFAGAGFPGWDTEHAAITETSLMLLFAPDLVRKDKIIDDQANRIPKYAIFPPSRDIIPASGVLYKATYASLEKGEKLATRVTDTIVKIIKQEFRLE